MDITQSAEPSSLKTSIFRLWDKLTKAPANLPPEQHRPARLLSTFLVVILILGTLDTFLYSLLRPEDQALMVNLTVLGILGIVYGICRSGRIELSTWLTVGVVSLGIFAVVISSSKSPNVTNLLHFLIIPIILANIFLSSRQVLTLSILQIMGILILPSYFPEFTLAEMCSGPIPFLGITAILFLIADQHRKQIAQDRQQALEASERRFRALVENIGDGIEVFDHLGRVMYASPSASRIHGYPIPDLLGHDYLEWAHPEDVQMLKESRSQIIRTGQPVLRTFRIQHQNGEWRWIEGVGTNFLYDPAIGGIVFNFRDVSQRKQAEEALQLSESRYRTLFEDVPVAIWEEDFSPVMRYIQTLKDHGVTDFRAYFKTHPEEVTKCAGMIKVLDINNTAVQMYEAESKEQLIRHTEQTISKGEQENNYDDFVAIAEGKTHNSWEGQDATLRGKTIEIQLKWSVAPTYEQDYSKTIVITTDITDRKRVEEKLRFQEAVLRETGRIAKVGGWSFDVRTGEGFWTEEVGKIHDLNPNDPTSKEIRLSFYVDESRARIEAAIQKTIESAVPYDLELEMITAKGNRKWVRTIGHPIIENGTVVSIRGSFQDITESKRAQTALLESSHQFRTLFEASPDAVVLINPLDEWKIIDCNTATCRMNGYAREELIGQSIDILNLEPADQAERSDYLKRVREAGVLQLETFHRRKDGTVFPVEVSTTLITLGGREIILGIDRDITDRKKSEEAMRQSETRLNGVIQSAMDAIISVNSEQRIVLFNVAAEKMFGKTATEVLGQPLDQFIPNRFRSVHSEHVRAFGQTGMTNRAMGTLGVISGQRANGEEFPIEASISQIEMASGKLYTVILRDVTERRQAEAEIRRLNADLEQRVAERTAQLSQTNTELTKAREMADRANLAKSEFLSRMSHELRTPLHAILGFGQLFGMEALDARQRENINHIFRAGKHLLGLINDVLDITRIETGNLSISPEPVRLKDLIQETLDLVESIALRRGIHIQLVKPSSEYVLADRQRLKQILLNLLSNAIKYNREEGQIMIDCLKVPGEIIQIRITDTGPGISPEAQTRLFIPFDRLGAEKGAVEGTGLGLSLSRRLAEVMGGRLEMESTLGKGSTFWVELPIVESPMEQSKAHDSGILQLTPHPEQTITHTVLCFEDNLSNMQLIEQIFKLRTGVNLLAVAEGRPGLEIASTQHLDLILLDVNLPDITGYEVLHRLKAHPSTRAIPVVVLSADATPGQIQRMMEAGAHTYLTKPLDVLQFLKVMDQLLDAPNQK